MEALVLGYGSAGKRHYKGLTRLGYKVTACDPYKERAWYPRVRFYDPEKALASRYWDLVVIASPPNQHLEQIKMACDQGLRVLCEKPLCDFGQEQRAQEIVTRYQSQVMMAYNYRFHSAFWLMNARYFKHARQPTWQIVSRQQRKVWPEWGFVLDHLAHAVDMLIWQSEAIPAITSAKYEQGSNGASLWTVHGLLRDKDFTLRDEVYHERHPRTAYFYMPDLWLTLTRDPGMFERMWRYCHDWLHGQVPVPYPSLEMAYQTQLVLATIQNFANKNGKTK